MKTSGKEYLLRFSLIVLAVLVTGTMFCACLPLGERAPLAWFALVPLLLATRGRGFLVGFLAGLGAVFFAAWLSTTGVLYGVPRGTTNDGWVYTGFGIFGGPFAVLFAVWGDRGSVRFPLWAFAALATLLEATLLVKLPSHLALSQYRNAAMVQLASVGGIWLVTYLVWWTNLLLSQRRWWAFATPALAFVFGGMWLPFRGETRRLAAFQTASVEEADLRRGQDEATGKGAALVVWPEFAGMLLASQGDTRALRDFGGAAFVTSFPDGASPLPHNTAALFVRGAESPPYWKRKLFGEETKMHAPGSRAVVAGDVGLNVCYDSCFPNVIRDSARLGASVVALPTNDPPSTHAFIAAMHAAYSPFRAAESGVAFARADSGAYSLIVDVRGRIVAEAPPGERVLVAEAVVGPRWTVSRLLGNWWLAVCGGWVVWGIVRARKHMSYGKIEEDSELCEEDDRAS